MRPKCRFGVFVFVVLSISACSSQFRQNNQSATQARNVILLIGDGMGFSELALARLGTVGACGRLHMDGLPNLAVVATHALDKIVTDSAAAATAMASDKKTINHAIGVDADGKPLTSALEEAKRAGKSTGLISTSRITDATPAAWQFPNRSI